MSLTDKTVLIVGGHRGIGFAAAKRAAAAGATLVIAGRSRDGLARALRRLPGTARAEQVDFSDEDDVRALFKRVGAIDHLVLSASSSVAFGGFAEMDTDRLRAAFDNKFWGYWFCARHGFPSIAPGGSILMVTGAAHRKNTPGLAGLAAVNAAIAGFAQTLAVELAPLRVNVVSPGTVDTEAYDTMPDDARQGMMQQAAAATPVGRVGTADEIGAAMVAVLENGFITGAIIDVDGGVQAT